MQKSVSRRNFLKASAIVGLSSVVNASTLDKELNFDEVVDVIIVGSGLAGMTAGIVCSENNLNTLMLERNNIIGGNSALGSLDIAAAGSFIQKQLKIKDTVKQFVEDMNEEGKGLNHIKHTQNIAKKSAEALSFIKERGVKFYPRLKMDKGHKVARSLVPKGGAKKGVIDPLFKHLNTFNNFKLYKNTLASRLIKNNKNEIIAIEVIKKDPLSGRKKYIYKSKFGIVFATGGYSQDKEFQSIQNPLISNVISSTQKNSKADSLKTLIEVGATPVQLSLMRYVFQFDIEILKYGCIISTITGKRFVDESTTRQNLANEILINMKKNTTTKYPITIFDKNGVSNFKDKSLLKKYSSLKELAEEFDVDFNKMSNEVKNYNKYSKIGYDKQFGKEISNLKIKGILTPPFYAMRIIPESNYTLGGVFIDTKARVINLRDKSVIPGLFAAGEITGGIHGQGRLDSCSSINCMVYGMIAGKEIIKLRNKIL